jgi:Ca-activated chloride channel family protein
MPYLNTNKTIQKQDDHEVQHISISKKGIEIKHVGKPVSDTALTGYVYLLVDCSASMDGNKIKQAKKGALNFTRDALKKGYYTGLIRFDSSAKLICEPFKDISNLERKLIDLEVRDTTHMAKAIDLAYRLLKEMTGIRVMVIVTDGMPNGARDPLATLESGNRAKKEGIEIITIGTDDADREFLKRLASRSDIGLKVENKNLEKAITDSTKLLPQGNIKLIKR